MVRGAKDVIARVEAEHAAIVRNQNRAVEAAARVVARHARKALPKGKTGYLRKHVRVFAVAEGVAKVKLTGRTAHLVYGSTAEHVIAPRSLEEAQGVAQRRFNARVRLPKDALGGGFGRFSGPVLATAKRAIAINGHPYARAVRPAHPGAAAPPLPAIRAEASLEARAAAAEVLRHG